MNRAKIKTPKIKKTDFADFMAELEQHVESRSSRTDIGYIESLAYVLSRHPERTAMLILFFYKKAKQEAADGEDGFNIDLMTFCDIEEALDTIRYASLESSVECD